MSEKAIGKCMFCAKDVFDKDIVSQTVKLEKEFKVEVKDANGVRQELRKEIIDDVYAPRVAVLKDGRLACYEHPGVLELSRGLPIPPPKKRGALSPDEEDTEED